MVSEDDLLIVDTSESDHRLEILHTNVGKYGTISNTVAAALTLTGRIDRRGEPSEGLPFKPACGRRDL